MSKKGAPAGKGPVISKGTPAPLRFKDGEAPPLPTFPITWTSMGVCVETVEPNASCPRIIEMVNATAFPDLSITLVDAQEMAEEEMFVEESELGATLRDVKKDFTDKKKDATKENWVTPELLSKLLAVRSNLDRDFQHREEEVRRTTALENAKKASEDAKAAVEAAKTHLAGSKEAVKAWIEQERIRIKAEKEAKDAADAAPPPPPEPKTKSPPKPPPKGKAGGKDKEPVVPVLDFKTELARLRQVVTDAEKSLQDLQQSVITTQETEASIEKSLQSPYITGRLYWCLVSVNSASYMAGVAAGAANTFGGVFNMIPRFVPPTLPEGAAAAEQPVPTPAEVPPTPSLVIEMRTLRDGSKLFEPARKVAVIDVFYDKMTTSPPEAAGDPKKAAKEKRPDKKGAADDSSVPYEFMAKALTTSFKNFLAQIRDFETIRKNAVCVEIPDATSDKDVEMTYYTKLLDTVPDDLVTVPIIMHCMVEQVGCYETPESSPKAEIKQCKHMGNIIKTSFLKTGHNIALDKKEPCCISRSEACRQLKCVISKDCEERLIVVHEEDRVGRLAATTLKHKLESTTRWSFPMSLDVPEIEKRMLQLLPTPGLNRRGMGSKPELTTEWKGAFVTALDAASHGFFSKAERLRKLNLYVSMCKKTMESDEEQVKIETESITNRYYIERLSETVLGQVFATAKLVLPFEASRYDKDDDCLLSALFVRDGEHLWQHQVHCQVPFGDLCTADWATELSRTYHLAYGVERYKAFVLEKMWLFFTKGDGLVRCGLPSAYSIRRAPQTSVYKDGNMYLLRKTEAAGTCFIACLKDGLILYFVIGEDGTTNLQMRSPTGRAYELTSSGVVLMFPEKEKAGLECSDPKVDTDDPAITSPTATGPTTPPTSSVATPVAAPNSEVKNVEPNELVSCSTNVVDLMKEEQGLFEHWRCVLPSGTVVRYMKNGDSQLCFANGNVSKWHLDESGDTSWETTNNKGETNAKFKRKEKPVEVKPEPPPEPPGKKKAPDKKAPEPPKVEEPVVVEPPKPSIVSLPTRKVVEISDPDTGALVSTREDLVVIVNSPADHTRLVQHADGTQIFSTVSIEQIEVEPAEGDSSGEVVAERAGSVEGNSQARTSEAGAPDKVEVEESTESPTENVEAEAELMPADDQSIEHAKKEYIRTVAWCAKNQGYPTVHGVEGNVVKVEFSTLGGHYTAGWSKSEQRLSVLLPCGSQLFSKGPQIIFKPADLSEADPRSYNNNNRSDADQTLHDTKEWEARYFHLGDEPKVGVEGAALNTRGFYVFDMSDGSLRHTDSSGNGFVAYDGTKADIVAEGVVVNPPDMPLVVLPPTEASSHHGEQSPADAQEQGKDLVTKEPAGEPEPAPAAEVSPSDGSAADVPPVETLPIEAPEVPPVMKEVVKRSFFKGPPTRLFAFYEGGHGFEILDEDDVEKYKLSKKRSGCHYASNKIAGDAEEAIFHVCVSVLKKRQCGVLEDMSLKCSLFQRDGDVEYAGAFDLSQRDFSLPRAMSPPKVGGLPDCRVTILLYRQILEYPMFHRESKEHVSLEIYSSLKSVMLELPSYVPKEPETKTKEAVHEQDNISNRIKEGPAEVRMQIARSDSEMERRLVERIITTLKQAEKERAEAVSKLEFEARMKQQFDLNFYRSHKKKVKCIHKPTGLLQSKGPFRPLSGILFLYFKCEEGLRALLAMLEQRKKKVVAGGKVCRSSIRKSIRLAREKMGPEYKVSGPPRHSVAGYNPPHGGSPRKVESPLSLSNWRDMPAAVTQLGAHVGDGNLRDMPAAVTQLGAHVGDKTVPLHGTTGLGETQWESKDALMWELAALDAQAVFGRSILLLDLAESDGEDEGDEEDESDVISPSGQEEEPIIKVKIDQLCQLSGESQLKVELIPVEPKAKPKAQLHQVQPAKGPVTVELQEVAGERPVKLKLRPTGNALDSSERPVKFEFQGVEGPVKLKFHEENGLPLRLEMVANPNFTDSFPEETRAEELPVDETKIETKATSISELERPSGMQSAQSPEDVVWMDDIEGTAGKSEVKKGRVDFPVKVSIHEKENGLVKVDIIPEQATMAEVGETRRVEFQALSMKQDWVAREDDYPRAKVYLKEDWVPREDEGLSITQRDSILWFDSDTESVLRTSSTKVVWYPNDKYLAGREWTTLQTSSMKLLKRLRPSVDRPQFKVSPEVVNLRKVKLGSTAMQIVTLYNYQSDLSRFKIFSQDACIRVVYDHGPLAAGMARRLKVYFKGSTEGQFAGKVHIETEFDIFIVPVLAEVLQHRSSAGLTLWLEPHVCALRHVDVRFAMQISIHAIRQGRGGAKYQERKEEEDFLSCRRSDGGLVVSLTCATEGGVD